MKKIAIIYRNRENPEVIAYLSTNLERIFGDYIFIENYHLNELPQNFMIIADAYLVIDNALLYQLRSNIPDFSSVVLMERSFSRENLQPLRALAPNTDVLVVNDTYENAIKTIYGLYEIDINHINFIPYDSNDPNPSKYNSFKICVTPNEPQLVPPFIETIINIGYREISFNTISLLMRKLELDFDSTNRNLIRHIRSIEEPNTHSHDNYLKNALKTQVLKNLSNRLNEAFFIVNENYELIYSNERADLIFGLTEIVPLTDIFGAEFVAALKKELPPKAAVASDGESYFIDKNAIMLMDEIIGYSISLQREKDLQEQTLLAKKQREVKGLYAKYTFSDIIHVSEDIDKCIALAKTAATTDYAVLITGESGVGKELFAQSLHNFSTRSAAAFVAVNCAALPESLLESELFGYESGSFTGASKAGKVGLFEQANGGTIFLDEIGDTSPHMQSRLLRVLQEHQIVRIGSDRVIDVDIRILAATNKDLREEVANGTFRKDLFYRLNVININVDPLRNRKEDILPLMAHFLGNKFKELTERDKNQLLLHDWPGNVRELESVAIHFGTLSSLPDYLYDSPAILTSAVDGTPAEPLSSAAALPLSDGTGAASLFSSAEPSPDGIYPPDGQTIRLRLLSIIAGNTHAFHGIGRMQLTRLLRERHIEIGDSNLRTILQEMQQSGWILIGRGREGTRITEAGIAEMQRCSQKYPDAGGAVESPSGKYPPPL